MLTKSINHYNYNPMTQTLAFDVYGTLINTSGVYESLSDLIPNQAYKFMATWRQKQLEYSFRRGLMDRHTDFTVCTRDALSYCCLLYSVDLDSEQRAQLMNEYTTLPAFPDAEDCLKECHDDGHRVFAFSNGSTKAVNQLLNHAGILSLFDGVVSTEDVEMFKPSPVVYNHFIQATESDAEDTWLISGNTFDVMGARSCGWNAAWVQRSPDSVFDPWDEFEPTVTIQNLAELPVVL